MAAAALAAAAISLLGGNLQHMLALYALTVVPLTLGSPLQSGMVLQRDGSAAVWGWTQPGASVVCRGSWGAKATSRADGSGAFKMKLKTGHAGGPYTVEVSDGQSNIRLDDVLLGEVWFCSGQSNMEMFLGNYRSPAPVEGWEKAVAGANHPRIRLYQVKMTTASSPAQFVEGVWQPCTSQTIMPFSAVAYFFGEQLQRKLSVPVGLIQSTWGGTESELWTSEASLRRDPELRESLDKYSKANRENERRLRDWSEKLAASDPGTAGNWSQKDLSDEGWEAVESPQPWSKSGWGALDGIAYYRAQFRLPADVRGKKVVLHLGQWDDDEVTWVNGGKVGATEGWSEDRNYVLPAAVITPGTCSLTVRVTDAQGEGGSTGMKVWVEADGQEIPVTNWRRRVGVDFKGLPRPDYLPARGYSSLYNGMVAPVAPFSIRGALWYQGEANVGRAYQYRRALSLMIEDWRKTFDQGSFPFYLVQIAPFGYGSGLSPELRDAQAFVGAKVKNAGMVSTMDLSTDMRNIHPTRKREVGERLAALALDRTYHIPTAWRGPQYKGMRIKGAEVTLSFSHAAGLHGSSDAFTVAGEDGVFKPATARVEGEHVIVSSAEVAKPRAVRFAWADTAVVGIWNSEGLPMEQFRTDSWPLQTKDVRW